MHSIILWQGKDLINRGTFFWFLEDSTVKSMHVPQDKRKRG